MKKILLTTTAMVAFAGAASAEVTLSGSAEMGIKGGDGMETQFHDDIDVSFTLSGETDNGLTFGAKIDLDEADVGAFTGGGTQLNAVFISGGFGTLTLGDTDGALDWAMTEVGGAGNPGSLLDETTTHVGYNGSYLDGVGDAQILRYDNTFGDFGVAISAEMDDTPAGQDTGFAVGLRYNLELGGAAVALGAGYQDANLSTAPAATSLAGLSGAVLGDGIDAFGLSASAVFDSGLSAGIQYTAFSGPAGVADIDHFGIGLGYATGALSMHANYGVFDIDGVGDVKGYGLAVGYDLGGGASVLAGYMSNKVLALPSVDIWSLGLAMSF